ncbi:hypothetical protein BCIN_12g01200 [Botrytis cinerea B05.10]|uniref:Uncharacterized protein n=1 Tax=Botryotinia fuckeliana (strain B05.10) TaxID=332648 RepID=A0A384JYC5_BOTFB|nr:hypothetical protein BCIN_12g01200 [Botrytis cinerea B05.10]ATZ55531.1 hypothetical protein BCIN_12g01200 [Botrytis cinerea B05.10]
MSGDYSNGDLSNGDLSNGDLSNGDFSNGNFSHGDHSNNHFLNNNLSNESSHSPASQSDWKKLYDSISDMFKASQAELQESRSECMRLQSQCRESQKRYEQLQEVWRYFHMEQEKEWRLQMVTARAFQEFQMVYEEERKQRLSTEQARKLAYDKIHERLQSGSETAQNTAGNPSPNISQSPFQNTGQPSVSEHFRVHMPTHSYRQHPGANLNLSPFTWIPARRMHGRVPAPE